MFKVDNYITESKGPLTQLGRFSTPLTGQNCKSLVRVICTKFSITNLLLGNCALGQYLGNVQNSLTKSILSQAFEDFLIITKPHKFQFNFTKKRCRYKLLD